MSRVSDVSMVTAQGEYIVVLSVCGWCLTITSHADPISAAAAAKDGTRKLSPRSKVTPAKVGPTIWPKAKDAVIRASILLESPTDRLRAYSRPKAAMPTNVPPRRTPPTTIASADEEVTVRATPPASITHATAKAAAKLHRRPRYVHNATEGIAETPTTSHTTVSRDLPSEEARRSLQ